RIADHRGRRLVEPEDDHSVIYGAREGGRIVGTGRMTFGPVGFGLPRQTDVYAATTGVRILSRSDGTLRKLMDEEPPLAAKLLFNIARMLCGRLIKANTATDI